MEKENVVVKFLLKVFKMDVVNMVMDFEVKGRELSRCYEII